MKIKKPSNVKKHYYLVSGNVVVNINDNVQAFPCNGMLQTDTRNLGVHQIGKAQQALQLSFMKKLGEVVQVVDVVINNMVHLGFMTEDEFTWRPEGVELSEVPKPSAEILDFTSRINPTE